MLSPLSQSLIAMAHLAPGTRGIYYSAAEYNSLEYSLAAERRSVTRIKCDVTSRHPSRIPARLRAVRVVIVATRWPALLRRISTALGGILPDPRAAIDASCGI